MIYVDTTQLEATEGRFRQHIEDQAKARVLEDAQTRLLGPGNRSAIRPKTAEEAGIRIQEARVEVRENCTDASDSFGQPIRKMEVAVYSLMKPGAFRRVLLDPRDPTAAVQIAAGACCEELCEAFGDPFDPAQAAEAAVEAYRRLRDA